jgi:hypothetical protein
MGASVAFEPIRNDEDLQRGLKRLEKIFPTEEGTPQANERDALVTLIEGDENEHCDFGPADRLRSGFATS